MTRSVQDERYPLFDEYCLDTDDISRHLTVRECRDCGVVVSDPVRHDAWHELMSAIAATAIPHIDSGRNEVAAGRNAVTRLREGMQ